MKSRRIIGKKGIAIDDIIEMLIMVGVVIGLAIFIVIFISGQKAKDNAESVRIEQEKIIGTDNLILYLNSADGSGESNANIFVRHYINSDIEDMGKSLAMFFDPIYYSSPSPNDWRSWQISVYNPEGNEVFMQRGTQSTNKGGLSTVFLAEVQVPIPSGEYATIKLYKVGRGDSILPTG